MRYLFLLILTPLVLFAKNASEEVTVHQVINKYRNAPAVEMVVDKNVTMSLLGEKKSSSGTLYLSSNKMRYQISKPEQHLIVMNDDSIWIENRLPKKLGGKIQVTHLKSKSSQDQVKGFLTAFFGNKNIKDDMDFTPVNDDTFKIQFKKKNKMTDIKSAKIAIDKKKETIKFLEYTNKLNNVTRHTFSEVNFKKDKKTSKFKYSPPKNAEVTEM